MPDGEQATAPECTGMLWNRKSSFAWYLSAARGTRLASPGHRSREAERMREPDGLSHRRRAPIPRTPSGPPPVLVRAAPVPVRPRRPATPSSAPRPESRARSGSPAASR
jgi:hypothetical protein